jgi:hypothetical protein
MAWLRYRVALLATVRPIPAGWSQANAHRYGRTVAGGWRYFREVVCPAEIAWYERQR